MSDEIERGSGNVYADLGIAKADDLKLKAQLVTCIQLLMQAEGLNQTAAAQKMGTTQPKLSSLMRGKFRSVSVTKLMSMLNALNQDIEIVVKPNVAKRRPARTRVKPQKVAVVAA